MQSATYFSSLNCIVDFAKLWHVYFNFNILPHTACGALANIEIA